MKTPVLLTALVFLLLSACSKSENYSENDLVEIYARIELEPVEKSIAMIEKYELDNEKNGCLLQCPAGKWPPIVKSGKTF